MGKDAIIARMRALRKSYHYAVTMTTRPKRKEEIDGFDYHFITKNQFTELVEQDKLLEWAKVYGNYYGVPKFQVFDALTRGQDVVLKIDVHGAATIKTIAPEALFIFIAPQNMHDLRLRLVSRKTESETMLELRLQKAQEEIKKSYWFDFLVINRQDCLDSAVSEIESIASRERLRTESNQQTQWSFLN